MTATFDTAFGKVLIAITALLATSCGVSAGPTLDGGARNAEPVTLPPVAAPVITAPTDTLPPVAAPTDAPTPVTLPPVTLPPVGAIEKATTTAPGFITLSGWARDSGTADPVAVVAWVDGVRAGTTIAADPHDSATVAASDTGFVLDLAIPTGEHAVCVTASTNATTPLDCIDLKVQPAAEAIADGTILLTAVVPDPAGSVAVRGVIAGSNPPATVAVTTDVDTVTTSLVDVPVTDSGIEIGVVDGSFRFELQGLTDGTYRLCPTPSGVTVSGVTVEARSTASTAGPCGTAIVGPLSIGTTGRAVGIDAVAPDTDHPLYRMDRDGGVSVELTDGSTLWLFGDTTDTTELYTNGTVPYFVNNTAAWASPDAPTLTRDVAATEPVLFAAPPPGTCDGSTKAALWPESAVALPQDDGTDRVVVVMSKVCVGDTSWLDIETVGYAVVEYRYDPADPPADRPIRGEVTQPDLADADTGYGRALLLEPDGHLYGYECGRFPDNWGPCRVARVLPEQVTDPTAWRYWNGDDWTDPSSWVPDQTAAAAMELPGDAQTALPVAAFGVTYNADFDTYLMVYSPWPGFCDELAVRVSDTPVGPWTDAVEITFPNCSGGEIPGLDQHCYAATPQTQLCEEDMFAGGYYDKFTDLGAARYYTFETPFVVVHDAR